MTPSLQSSLFLSSVLGRLIVEVSRSQLDTHTHGRTPLNEWSARRRGRYLHNTQQTQETNIHAFSGIRTRDPRNGTAWYLRLRPRGQIVIRPTLIMCGDGYKQVVLRLLILRVVPRSVFRSRSVQTVQDTSCVYIWRVYGLSKAVRIASTCGLALCSLLSGRYFGHFKCIWSFKIRRGRRIWQQSSWLRRWAHYK
jgi:hypothetical protein